MSFGPRSRRSLSWLWVGLWLVVACPAGAREIARFENDTEFDSPTGLEARVQHWVDIFSRYSLTEAVVHDRLHPEYVLAVVPLKNGRGTELAQIKERYQELIQQVAGNPAWGISPFLHLFQVPIDPRRIAAATDRVRVQRGQREVMGKSIVRSRRYMKRIRQELQRLDLPERLAYLPHVESSFNSRARSRAGAVGLWQLMPATARPALRVDRRVDERTHPYKATKVAGEYLRHAHEKLGNWPLAITAYNYGLSGTMRAVEAVGSRHLPDIIDRHEGGNFGFAVRNFYAQFLAAAHVAENAGLYFPELVHDDGIEHVVCKGDTLWDLARRYGVSIEAIRRANMLSRSAHLRLGQRLLIHG
ncbi:MAG: transglycosylase SLT domain-containing protein [Candidatus Binatia bacterium]|nr:transglycosylase SLT domain-containing protein [Candidatus Binatia bacterium]